MYSNTLINITKKRKSKSIINNTEFHDTRNDGKAVAGGSQVEEYRIYNTEVVPTVKGFNRYIKNHSHVGYNGADEIVDRETEFVIPRITKDTCLMDTMIISPGFRIPASEKAIEEFMASGDMQFFYDYVNEFMANDPKLKHCKILSAIVHFDEVHFPRSEYDENGDWVRDYTDEESLQLAYIPIHMHVNYIPLTKEKDKDGKEYLKLSHKEIWRSEKGKYWQSYKEFNDRQFESVGKKYGLGRGNIWEDWKTRIQEAENGKKAKKKRDLTNFIMDQEQKRVDGIKKQQAQLKEEVQVLELGVKDYQIRIDRLKTQLIDSEHRIKELRKIEADMKAEFERREKLKAQMIEDEVYNQCFIDTPDGTYITDFFDEILKNKAIELLIDEKGNPTEMMQDLYMNFIRKDYDMTSLDNIIHRQKIEKYKAILKEHGIDEFAINEILNVR